MDVHHRVPAGDGRPLLTSLDIRNDLRAVIHTNIKSSDKHFKPRPLTGTIKKMANIVIGYIYERLCFSLSLMKDIRLFREYLRTQLIVTTQETQLNALTFSTIKLHPSPVVSMHKERGRHRRNMQN